MRAVVTFFTAFPYFNPINLPKKTVLCWFKLQKKLKLTYKDKSKLSFINDIAPSQNLECSFLTNTYKWIKVHTVFILLSVLLLEP